MSSPDDHVDLPEGLSPEMAEAYRRGYERARRQHEPTVAVARPEPTVAVTRPAVEAPPVRRAPPGRTPHQESVSSTAPRLWKVAGAAVVSAALVAGAFGLGRMLTPDPVSTAAPQAAGNDVGRSGDLPVSRSEERTRYSGPVSTVRVTGGRATCQSGDSVDAVGNPVDYAPGRAFDSDLSTAWRCDGPASGQRLTLDLPAGTPVAELGLVPGYAKTDPGNGVDRYAENNRVTRVRWHLGGGASFVQQISDDPSDRSMRTLRIPTTRTATVVLEVLDTAPGSRDTTPVSEVRVAAADR